MLQFDFLNTVRLRNIIKNIDLTGKLVNRVGSSSVNLPVDSKTVLLILNI